MVDSVISNTTSYLSEMGPLFAVFAGLALALGLMFAITEYITGRGAQRYLHQTGGFIMSTGPGEDEYAYTDDLQGASFIDEEGNTFDDRDWI